VRPLFSVCIPAYNRASVLPALLESILTQDFDSFEVIINEDGSPERSAIRGIAERYSASYPGRIRYFENDRNLGFDANLRSLVERSKGEYCVFMGNDDLMCAGALFAVAGAVRRYPQIGVVVRSYASFDGSPDNINQIFRYFPEERFFAAGPDTISTVYRRSVVIPGMVIHRDAAHRYATAEFDGTLLYQLYLVANILVEMNAVFLPQIIVLYRNGGVPDFGNAEAERGKFVPADRTPASSLQFMRGMLDIARAVERSRDVPVYRRIVSDIANYSYPILAVQVSKPLSIFASYWWRLARMGFGRAPLFHLYFISLVLLGAKRSDAVIAMIKRRVGYTPNLGSLFGGKKA
jgi:glycosyltransferase involved in cell wall biosynthesis